jgi:hypothetical protein
MSACKLYTFSVYTYIHLLVGGGGHKGNANKAVKYLICHALVFLNVDPQVQELGSFLWATHAWGHPQRVLLEDMY